jgi:hypothetical protein
MVDEIYTLNSVAKLKFNLTTYRESNEFNKSFYREYKTSNKKEGSVMISRRLDYFLSLEYNYKGDKNSVMIYPDHMLRLIERFTYINNNWLGTTHNTVFGIVNSHLSVISQCESIIIPFPCEKILRIDPVVDKREDGREYPGLIMYIGDSNYPIELNSDKFSGLLYCIARLDMCTYANIMASSVMCMGEQPRNRVSFDSEESMVDQSTSTGKSGRDFKFKSNGFFD